MATNSSAFFDDLLTDTAKKEEPKTEEAPKVKGDFFDDLISNSSTKAEEEAPPSDPDTITTGGFFDDLVADSSTPDELKALKEKGVFLPDDKEKVIYDASRDEPISTKVGKFFKGILPAGWGIVKNTAVGAKNLAWNGVIKPLAVGAAMGDEYHPLSYDEAKPTLDEAGNSWRSFGSGAVKTVGGLAETGTKAVIGGTAATDALKEVTGLQTPEESFDNYLKRTRFQDALNRDAEAHPDAMAHGLAGLADSLKDSGIAPEAMGAMGDSFREQELTKDQIDLAVEGLAEVVTPIGPVAVALKPVSKLTKGVTNALGGVALKGLTKVAAPLVEKGGKKILQTGEAWDKITQAAAQAVSGDPHALWQKVFSEPLKTATRVIGIPAQRLGEAGKDIGRQIDDIGQAGRTGLFERAGADATSGPVIKTLFGKGLNKEATAASGLEDVSGIAGVGERIGESAKATGPFRARAADRLSRAMGYYAHKGIDGAIVGTLLGIPNIENAEDFGSVVGSGVGIGLVVGSAPSAIRQARVEALRGDQDADIARMRRDAAPETVAKLDSLTDRDAYVAHLQGQVDSMDAALAALKSQPDSPEKSKMTDHLTAVRAKTAGDIDLASKAGPEDMKEANRLLNLEFTDSLDQAKTTGRAAGLGNNLEVHLLSSDEIAAKVDSMFAGDKEQAEAVISHLNGKTLTPDEQTSLDAAKQKLADIATNREHWPQQRGFALEAGAIPESNAPAVIINSDHLLSQRGTNLARVLRHEIFHGLMNFNEVKEKVQPLVDSYFDTKIKMADGTVVDGDRGIYSDADLDKMIPVYARKLDPLHDGQQWLSRFNTPEDARNAIKEELLAENFTNTSKQGALRSVLDSPAQSLADWWHLTNLNKSIAETRDQLAEAGLPLDGSGKVSNVLGAKLTDQSLALMRKFQRQMRDYNEGLTLASDSSLPSEKKIPFTKILANRALQEHFKDADFWAREAVTQVLDASGNPVHEQVLTPKEAETMPVGEWVLKGGVFTNAEDGSVMPSPAPAAAKALPDGTRVVNKVRIARKADGTPKILSKSVTERLSRVRGKLIQEALDGAPDAGEANRLRNTGNGSYRGIATPAQIARVMKLPDIIVHPALKAKFKALNDSLARGDGTRHITEYQPALLGGEYRALSPKISDFVPIGFQFSKQGNFLVTVVSVSRLHSKMEAWVKQKPARLDLWKGDTGDFWQDFVQLLQNHQSKDAAGNDVHGETGLDADPKRALEKKNILNDFLNLSTKETEANNPSRSKLKTPKGKDSPDRTISSYRLDRMLSLEESYAQKMPINYGKVVANFLPKKGKPDEAPLATLPVADLSSAKVDFSEAKEAPLSGSRFNTGAMPLFAGKPLDDNSSFLAKFLPASGGGAAAHLRPTTPGPDKTRLDEHGRELPEFIRKLAIPPSWVDVRISHDPDAALLAQGKDAKGRVQSRYSDSHSMKMAAAKFNRIKELMDKFDEISSQNAENLNSDEPKTRENAAVSALIHHTGIRPGGEGDTGAAHKAYGATTLEGRHVHQGENNGVVLRYVPGKSHGVEKVFPISSPEVAQMLLDRKAKAGDAGQLFNTDAGSLGEYTRSLGGGGFKTKDFRTYIGTSTAIEEINKMPKPKSEKDYKKAVKAVATVVANKLGNTPTVALQSYIDPTVFTTWQDFAPGE